MEKAKHVALLIGAWIADHPTEAWPVFTALAVLLFKPRTPEQYARLASRHPVWFFARLAAFWQLLGGAGLDPLKVAKAAWKVVTGKSEPPPAGPGALLLLVLAFGLSSSACVPARSVARGAVLTSASAVKVADETCAQEALERSDLQLAKECEEAYTDARSALLGAAKAVDAWDDARTRSGLRCSLTKAGQALSHVVEVLQRRGAKVPPVVVDAVKLAAEAGGACS